MHLLFLQKYDLDKGVWLELHVILSLGFCVCIAPSLWAKSGFCYLDQWYEARSVTSICSGMGNFSLYSFILRHYAHFILASCREKNMKNGGLDRRQLAGFFGKASHFF